MQITGSGNPGGSSYITIRGANSILATTRHSIIVDGVPVSHRDRGANAMGGFDFGSAVNDINPDDIESMTVLKGPNAAALYGSRAANGVILITTKSGRNTGGRMRVDGNSFYTFENPSRLPDYQNQYGQGAGGAFEYIDGAGGGVNDGADQSWGPKLDGRTSGCTFVSGFDGGIGVSNQYDTDAPCKQFTAINGGPWIAHPEQRPGLLPDRPHRVGDGRRERRHGSRECAPLRLARTTSRASFPARICRRPMPCCRGNLQINDRLSAQLLGPVRPQRRAQSSRPGLREQHPRELRLVRPPGRHERPQGGLAELGDVEQRPTGREFNWNYNYHNNPFFLMNGNPENDMRDRLIGNLSATYKITDWLNLTGRTARIGIASTSIRTGARQTSPARR